MEQIALHYLWWILALVLIAIEVILPGYFMLWIGIAELAKDSLSQQQASTTVRRTPPSIS